MEIALADMDEDICACFNQRLEKFCQFCIFEVEGEE